MVMSMVSLVILTAPVVQAEPTIPTDNVPDPTTQTSSAAGTGAGPPGPDTLFMASATIMAFAVFGTALGKRIQRNPKKRDPSHIARVFTSLSILILVVFQGLFMFRLVVGGDIYSWGMLILPPVSIWIPVTTACLAVVAYLVTEESYSGKKSGGGLWKRWRRDKYRVFAQRTIYQIQCVCGYTASDPKREEVGAVIVRRICEVYRQGGEDNYRYALALWQIGNAVYPEYVTKKDRPQLVKNLWDRPVPDV